MVGDVEVLVRCGAWWHPLWLVRHACRVLDGLRPSYCVGWASAVLWVICRQWWMGCGPSGLSVRCRL